MQGIGIATKLRHVLTSRWLLVNVADGRKELRYARGTNAVKAGRILVI